MPEGNKNPRRQSQTLVVRCGSDPVIPLPGILWFSGGGLSRSMDELLCEPSGKSLPRHSGMVRSVKIDIQFCAEDRTSDAQSRIVVRAFHSRSGMMKHFLFR
jgi:hypothetical protein